MWKRLSLTMIAVVAITALITAGTFALFSSAASNTSTFASGDVTITAPAEALWEVENIVPGWGDIKSWTVTYEGTVPAWIGLDGKLEGDLHKCEANYGFDVWLWTNYGGFDIAFLGGYNENQENMFPNIMFPGDEITYYAWPYLYYFAGNDCELKATKMTFNAHAVQAYYNTKSDGSGPYYWYAGETTNAPAATELNNDINQVKANFLANHPKLDVVTPPANRTVK